MTDDRTEPTESLSDSIRRALEAAAAANDAAEEASFVTEQSRREIAASLATQRKLLAVAGGSFAAALVSVALGGLVYLRSTADLRESAEIQAAASKAAIEQIQAMNQTVTAAQDALKTITELKDQIGARIDGLGDRLSQDLAQVSAESAALQPQIATSIKDTVEASLGKTSSEILTALAQLEADLSATAGSDPELVKLLTDLKSSLGKPAAAPAPKPKTPKTTAAPKPKPKANPKPSAPASTFSYP